MSQKVQTLRHFLKRAGNYKQGGAMTVRDWSLTGHKIRGHHFYGDTLAEVLHLAGSWVEELDTQFRVLDISYSTLLDDFDGVGYTLTVYWDEGDV